MNIKEMRKDKGLTQKQLAEQIGVNIRWVQKLEAGDTKLENITFLNAIKLIRALTPYDDEKQLAREMYIILKGRLKTTSHRKRSRRSSASIFPQYTAKRNAESISTGTATTQKKPGTAQTSAK